MRVGPGRLSLLLAMGATEYEPVTPRAAGFTTASFVDPFGNVLGIMHNPHYLEMLAARGTRGHLGAVSDGLIQASLHRA